MGKYRLDFVTNSSSSSFIFARKSDCTVEEIKAELLKNLRDLYFDKYMIEEYGSEEECLDAFANWLFSMAGGFDSMKLDDWTVVAIECSNEDDEFYGTAYHLGYLGTDNFKMG